MKPIVTHARYATLYLWLASRAHKRSYIISYAMSANQQLVKLGDAIARFVMKES